MTYVRACVCTLCNAGAVGDQLAGGSVRKLSLARGGGGAPAVRHDVGREHAAVTDWMTSTATDAAVCCAAFVLLREGHSEQRRRPALYNPGTAGVVQGYLPAI